jgi:hypothetical protein
MTSSDVVAKTTAKVITCMISITSALPKIT